MERMFISLIVRSEVSESIVIHAIVITHLFTLIMGHGILMKIYIYKHIKVNLFEVVSNRFPMLE